MIRRCNLRHCYIPVSYTHLDVYKRQVLPITVRLLKAKIVLATALRALHHLKTNVCAPFASFVKAPAPQHHSLAPTRAPAGISGLLRAIAHFYKLCYKMNTC